MHGPEVHRPEVDCPDGQVRASCACGTLGRMTATRSRGKRWSVLARRHPSAFLLAAQLISLVLYPLLDEAASGRVVFGAFGALVLLLAVWVVNRTPAINWIAWLIAVPAFVLSMLSVATGSQSLLVWASLAPWQKQKSRPPEIPEILKDD